MRKNNQRRRTAELGASERQREFEQRVMEFAAQIGSIVGTAEAKTHKWTDPAQLTDRLARIRDHAAELLTHLNAESTKASQPPPQALAADLVHAPGKRHRKAPPAVRGIKHSDQRIAKSKAAAENRRGPQQRG